MHRITSHYVVGVQRASSTLRQSFTPPQPLPHRISILIVVANSRSGGYPSPMLSRMAKAVLALAALIATSLSGFATQVENAAQPLHFNGGTVELLGPWKFHVGDNSAWASMTCSHSVSRREASHYVTASALWEWSRSPYPYNPSGENLICPTMPPSVFGRRRQQKDFIRLPCGSLTLAI